MRHGLVLSCLLLLVVVPFSLPLAADEHAADENAPSDPRVGTVLAVQGRAFVRPVAHRRWSPLAQDALLLPGDLVKTAARGANALEISVLPAGSLLLGPGALVEMRPSGEVHVLRGELEVRSASATALNLTGPADGRVAVTDTAWLRVQDGTVATLENAPRWVTDYRAAVGEEWMGSLLAKVDGRDVPLAVGYHKVTADIRDQIARTTVEQSFVNTTDARLEGVFYFPLPADASISGFAMWIGNELVEADVVEKARARQIYEDILRRKKDPGLLEWQGGNLFKARVFPIEPRSEKRVRIRYTQVLPLEGSTWRYRYALRSDLLRSKPLRRLDIQVNVLSQQTITSVTSPSHVGRIRSTGHEARFEFDAEEFVPQRDFEVAVSLMPSSGVNAIAHRRGDDGYFMLLVQPPAPEAGGWTRDLVPDGDPLDVILVADTSGSMDAAARDTQSAFFDAFLSLLSENDRFRLAVADAEVQWPVAEPTSPTETAVAGALGTLSARPSLGWTDLDRALDAVLAKAGPGTLVVYAGDGIPTTADADPAAEAARLQARAADAKATVHAVACASTYEAGVLAALAAIGGGSFRRADGNPVEAARALLAEAARPALRDVTVSIEGVATARVYPAKLPNLPVGTQHAVLGRFLPPADGSQAQVVVAGRLGDEAVRYHTTLDVPAADGGNSFLPRLWARKHLDALLAEGRSPAIQAEIVAFSQRFGILTPYTSFLVLESDEDRERYGVARTAQMRDGESFFAEGRDQVALEMLREHARTAKAWRFGLRRRMLREIKDLGRDLVPTDPLTHLVAVGEAISNNWEAEGSVRPTAGVPVGGLRRKGRQRGLADPAATPSFTPKAMLPPVRGAPEPVIKDAEIADHVETDNDLPFEESRRFDLLVAENSDLRAPSDPNVQYFDVALPEAELGRAGFRRPTSAGTSRDSGIFYSDTKDRRGFASLGSVQARRENLFYAPVSGFGVETLGWPVAPGGLEPRPERPLPGWDPAVFTLLASLDRREVLAALSGGVHVVWNVARVHPVRGDTLALSSQDVLYSSTRYFVRTEREDAERVDDYCDGESRVRIHAWRRLGRKRPAVAADQRYLPEALGGIDHDYLIEALRRRRVYVEETPGGALVTLRIEGRRVGDEDRVLRIDSARRVIVEERVVARGRTRSRIRHSGFVEVAGLWWPRLTEEFDIRNRRVAHHTREVRALDTDGFDERLGQATQAYEDVLFVGPQLPPIAQAERARAENQATFADHLAVVLDEAGRQRWTEAFAAWTVAKTLVGDGPGTRWVDLVLLARGRRGSELVAALSQLTKSLSDRVDEGGAWWAKAAYGLVSSALSADERIALLEGLEAPWTATGTRAEVRYLRWLHAALQQAGRGAEARALRVRILDLVPFDVTAIVRRAGDLQAVGDVAAARALLEERRFGAREREVFTEQEKGSLYGSLRNLLFAQRDLPAVRRAMVRQTEDVPTFAQGWHDRISFRYLRGDVIGGDAWVLEQLAGEVPTDIFSEPYAQLTAAIDIALGVIWQQGASVVEPIFVPVLVDLGRRLARREPLPGILQNKILGSWSFRRTDGRRLLIDALRGDLARAPTLDALAPERVLQLVRALPWGAAQVEEDVFGQVVANLEARTRAIPPGRNRDAVREALLAVLAKHGDTDRVRDVLRAWHAEASGFRRTEAAARLLEAILETQDATLQDEAFALLPDLLDPLEPDRQDRVAAVVTRRLAAWAFEIRRRAALGPTEGQPERTRAEARRHAKEALATARRGLVERLTAARDAAPAVYRRWLEIERLGYAVELGETLPQIDGDARELLDGVPKTSEEAMDRLLAERAALVLAYAANRRDAPEGAAERTLALFEARSADAADRLLGWRYEIFRLLVALDRIEAVEAQLRAWIREENEEAGGDAWRLVLARLEAERGRLEEAVALLEDHTAPASLSAGQWNLLADWYLALGDDTARERAMQARYDAMSEYELRNLLSSLTPSTSRRGGGMPADVDPEAFRVLRTLLAKASQPNNHLWRVRRFYESVRDHRTLTALAEGVPGHTPGAIYDYLQALGPIVAKVFEEATVDEAVTAIRRRQASVKHDHERRGLRLLEALFSARAALVKNADPIHVERAVAALTAVGEGTWEPGERRRLALLLAALPKVEDVRLARVVVTLERSLLEATPATSVDRLVIADALARTLWRYDETEDALDLLATALAAERERTGRPLSREALEFFHRQVQWLADAGRTLAAETAITDEMGRQALQSVRTDLLLRAFRLWGQALEKGGRVRLGSGETLLTRGTAQIDVFLLEGPVHRCRHAVDAVVSMHRAAEKAHVVPDAGARLDTWARERLPLAFDRLFLEAADCTRDVARGIQATAGPKPAIGYVLDRLDAEPAYLVRIQRGLWTRIWQDLANWRQQAGDIGALAPRLLVPVTLSLEKSLRGSARTGRYFWQDGYRQYWAEQIDAFTATALRVAELDGHDAQTQLRAARYLHRIKQRRLAIAVLETMRARNLQDAASLTLLASWLAQADRHLEAVPVVEELLERWDPGLDAYVLAAQILQGAEREEEARRTLVGAEENWRARGRWTDGAAFTLASGALEIEAFALAETWVRECLRLREEAGRRPESAHHVALGRALAGRGRTHEAVQAFATALGTSHPGSGWWKKADAALHEALAQAPDLDAFAREYEAGVAADGMDAPLLRKALARVYVEKDEAARALPHLLAARVLAPEDAEVHRRLVAVHDALGDAEGAVEALFASLRLAPRNLDAAADLANRLAASGRQADAERAQTNLVEPLPEEADGHRRLAVLRRAQGRLAEAEVQWRQVVRTDPLDPTGWLALGITRAESGDPSGAREAFEHILAHDWEDRFADVERKAAKRLGDLGG